MKNHKKLQDFIYRRVIGMQRMLLNNIVKIYNGKKVTKQEVYLWLIITHQKIQNVKISEKIRLFYLIHSNQLLQYNFKNFQAQDLLKYLNLYFFLFIFSILNSWMPRNVNSIQNESTHSHLVLPSLDNSRTARAIVQKILRLKKQILEDLQLLFQFRLVQKLARPIQIDRKKKMVYQYKCILEQIHDRMNKMEMEKDLNNLTNQKQSENLQKIKKKLQTIMQVKLALFGVRKRYTEVVIQSSLTFYEKICSIHSIDQPIKIMDADKWLTICVQKIQKNVTQSKQNCC